MLDDALADAMAEGGGLGFAQIVEAQLTGQGSAPELPRASRLRGAFRGVGVAQSAVAAYKAATGPLSVIPVHGRESSQFGPRTNPITGKANYHTGLDIAARTGTPARSSGDGVVIRARRSGGYGNMVIVDHGNGLTTRYAHLSEFKVKKGDQVQAGSVIWARWFHRYVYRTTPSFRGAAGWKSGGSKITRAFSQESWKPVESLRCGRLVCE